MNSSDSVSRGWQLLATRLVHAGRPDVVQPDGNAQGVFVNSPVSRGSTVLFPDLATMKRNGALRYEHETIYGAMGSPIQHDLERAVAEIEGGTDTQIVSSGLAACTTALLAFTSAGGHILLPDSIYGPTRRFADTMLRRFGVTTTYYRPEADIEELAGLLRSTTQVIFAESPGSHTFEVQDVSALADLAHDVGAKLLLDNTWGFGVFEPFRHGVDVSIQALTKYAAGHSDAIIGAITVADRDDWQTLRDATIQLGQLAGPDECWLTLRGLRTMSVRLAHQARSTLECALWLQTRQEVHQVLHPALPGAPGHEIWKRDFTGAGTVFGVVLKDRYTSRDMERMIDSLKLFGIGASWGGFESLVLPTSGGISRTAGDMLAAPAFRLNIGLENVTDLCADLEEAFSVLESSAHERLSGV
ncbi:MAG: cystathionine beta-lyase [Acetobacter sp.]|nr:cystathionine beta-lyase [Acetobacter sp.]